jgi:hypothetical protein
MDLWHDKTMMIHRRMGVWVYAYQIFIWGDIRLGAFLLRAWQLGKVCRCLEQFSTNITQI